MEKLARDEKGYALILVLILLLVGSLIIAPLLAFMSTGLKTGMVYERKTEELYAADAGIEYALWKIMGGQPLADYLLPELVNGKQVQVFLPSGTDEEITFFVNIGVLPGTGGDYNRNKPQAEWLVVYIPIESEPGVYGSYRVTSFYTAEQQPRELLTAGFWIHEYISEAVTVIQWDESEDGLVEVDLNLDGDTDDEVEINGELIDEDNIVALPLIDGFDPVFSRTAEFPLGSEAFIWEWDKGDGPPIGKGLNCRTQRFELNPPIILGEGEKFPPNVAFLETKEKCIQISWSGDIIGIYSITAIATDPATGKSTTVESYVFIEELGEDVFASILTFEIDPPAIE